MSGLGQIIGVFAVIVTIGVILYFTRKAGVDGQRAQTAEANLAKAKDAAAPVTPAERADAIKLFQRD